MTIGNISWTGLHWLTLKPRHYLESLIDLNVAVLGLWEEQWSGNIVTNFILKFQLSWTGILKRAQSIFYLKKINKKQAQQALKDREAMLRLGRKAQSVSAPSALSQLLHSLIQPFIPPRLLPFALMRSLCWWDVKTGRGGGWCLHKCAGTASQVPGERAELSLPLALNHCVCSVRRRRRLYGRRTMSA